MDFSKEQQQKIDTILHYVSKHDTVVYDTHKSYILLDDELQHEDEDLCSSSKCIKKHEKEIRKQLPKYSRLKVEIHEHNSSDHDRFEYCYICGKPLNSYLTWYETELDILIEDIKNINDIKEPINAFKIYGILKSVGWLCDSINSDRAKEKLINFIDKTFDLIK